MTGNTLPDLVIFDCDGVLVDSETPSNEVLVANLSRYGLTLTLQECMGLFVGGSMAGVMAKARDMGAELPDHWIDEIYGETYARLREGVNLVPGIPELLQQLDLAGIPSCVASNGSADKMRITLGQNGLWDRFEKRMFSAHSLGISKPDPGLFLAAAQQFGVPPSACVVIEDSANGVTAATRAGMRCLGYAPHDDGKALSALEAEVISDMRMAATLLSL